jgi:hypothetical protein
MPIGRLSDSPVIVLWLADHHFAAPLSAYEHDSGVPAELNFDSLLETDTDLVSRGFHRL